MRSRLLLLGLAVLMASPSPQAPSGASECRQDVRVTKEVLQAWTDAAAAVPSPFLPTLELARCLDLAWQLDRLEPTIATAETAFRAEGRSGEVRLAGLPLLAGADIAIPARTRHEAPKYPDQAAAEGITGLVIVEATIDREGVARRAEIGLSVPRLDKAAIDAVRKWRFAPSVANGQIVEVVTYVPLKFGQTSGLWASDYLEIARFYYQKRLWRHTVSALRLAREAAREDAERFGQVYEGMEVRKLAGFTFPQVIKEHRPTYTQAAMKEKVMGDVEVRVLVDRFGEVGRVAIVRPLRLLNVAALQSATQWKFSPGRLNGQPVSVVVSLLLTFRLH